MSNPSLSDLNYQSITPAIRWAFVQFPVEGSDEILVVPVAAWISSHDRRKIVGLVCTTDTSHLPSVPGITVTSVEPPALPGEYKPFSELNDVEREALQTGKPVSLRQHAPLAPAQPRQLGGAPSEVPIVSGH